MQAIKAMFTGAPCHALPNAAPLTSVSYVDLSRYLGRWFQYAAIPTPFQPADGRDTTATYSLDTATTTPVYIKVKNETYVGNDAKEPVMIEGKAWAVEGEGNAKLKVQFFWPFTSDYWVLQLGDKDMNEIVDGDDSDSTQKEPYGYAVVGNPKRASCWILSRKTKVEDHVYQRILERLKEQGYDTSAMVKTHHSDAVKST